MKMKKIKGENGLIMTAMLPLMATLVISVGVYTYNSAKSTITNSSIQLEQTEKSVYNSTIEQYIGNNKSGSEIKQMIAAVISQNNQYVGENGKFISILVDGTITNYSREDELEDACDAANTYEGGDNTLDNVATAQTEMNQLSNAIAYGKKYNVTSESEDGIIHTVIISVAN